MQRGIAGLVSAALALGCGGKIVEDARGREPAPAVADDTKTSASRALEHDPLARCSSPFVGAIESDDARLAERLAGLWLRCPDGEDESGGFPNADALEIAEHGWTPATVAKGVVTLQSSARHYWEPCGGGVACMYGAPWFEVAVELEQGDERVRARGSTHVWVRAD